MLLLLSLFDKNVLITLVEGDATLVEHQSCCPGADLLPLCRSWTRGGTRHTEHTVGVPQDRV